MVPFSGPCAPPAEGSGSGSGVGAGSVGGGGYSGGGGSIGGGGALASKNSVSIAPMYGPFPQSPSSNALLNNPWDDSPYCGNNLAPSEQLCTTATSLVTGASAVQGGASALGSASSAASTTPGDPEATAAAKPAAGRAMADLRWKPNLQKVAEVGRDDTFAKVGTGLNIAGGVLSGFSAYQGGVDNGESTTRAAAVGTVTAGVDVGIGWGSAWAGAAIGAGAASVVPVIGTFGGAVVGFVAGAAISFGVTNYVNNLISSVGNWLSL